MSHHVTTRARARDAEALRRLQEFSPGTDLSALTGALLDSRIMADALGGYDPYATADDPDEPDEPDRADGSEHPMQQPTHESPGFRDPEERR
jgi:hypothetical protein